MTMESPLLLFFLEKQENVLKNLRKKFMKIREIVCTKIGLCQFHHWLRRRNIKDVKFFDIDSIFSYYISHTQKNQKFKFSLKNAL